MGDILQQPPMFSAVRVGAALVVQRSSASSCADSAFVCALQQGLATMKL